MATAKKSAPVVAFLSDFGLVDSYVAEVKGVLLGASPTVRIVDVTHQVPTFGVGAGAFQLLRSYLHFPVGTVHLAVVDPGVGSQRACLFVKTKRYVFVGPDNGVLRWAVEHCAEAEGVAPKVFRLDVPKGASSTFHARDVFAPAIAHYLRKPSAKISWASAKMNGPAFPVPRPRADGGVVGVVLAIDHFGNLITSVEAHAKGQFRAKLADRGVSPVSASHYGAIPEGDLGLVRGSHGFWEIAARSGSAAERTKARLGHEVAIFPDEGPG